MDLGGQLVSIQQQADGGQGWMRLVLAFWDLSSYGHGLSFQKWYQVCNQASCYQLDFTSFSHLSPASCGRQGPCTDLSPQHDAFMLVEVLILLTSAVHEELPVSWAPCGQVTWVSRGVWLLWIRCCGITLCHLP